jgi:hypothetical protein
MMAAAVRPATMDEESPAVIGERTASMVQNEGGKAEMPRRRRRVGDATSAAAEKGLRRIARLFRDEIATRRWGETEFEKLVAESSAAGEAVDAAEREAVRRVLAMLERTISVKQTAVAAIEVLERVADGGSIPIPVVRDLVTILGEQAEHAVNDAFAALRASARREPRRGRAAMQKEAARLAALRPTVLDLRSSIRAIDAVSPRRRGAKNTFSRSLQDALGAAAFLERAVGHVVQVLAGEGRQRRSVARAPLLDMLNFIARSASFVQNVVTLRLAGTGVKN